MCSYVVVMSCYVPPCLVMCSCVWLCVAMVGYRWLWVAMGGLFVVFILLCSNIWSVVYLRKTWSHSCN